MRALTLTVAALVALPPAAAMGAPGLELEATIAMPAVKGRFDHLAADAKGARLFVAALGNNSVEVLDTAANRHRQSVGGFNEPQGLLYLPRANRLYVANGLGNRVDVLEASSLALFRRIDKVDDADNLRYDETAGVVVVGHGEGALRLLQADSDKPAGDIPLAGHPESFQLESKGTRAFVNVPAAQQVAVVDRATRKVVATWPIQPARANFPMALDEGARRVFVGTRVPPLLLVYDMDSGKRVAQLPIGGDTDDMFFDAARRRVYVVCGEGRVDVFRQETADRYVLAGSDRTAPGARTGLFVPEQNRLYVAAPAQGSSSAQIFVFRVK